MRARERRDRNRYNTDRCKICRVKAIRYLASGVVRCNHCGHELETQ